MTISDNMPLAESGNQIPISKSPGEPSEQGPGQAHSPRTRLRADLGQILPAWSAALPLWASTNWLWLSVSSSNSIRYWTGMVGQMLSAGPADSPKQVPLTISYSLIVLDCRAVRALPDDWWAQLERMMLPGGLALVCCRRDGRLPERVGALSSNLCPGTWHVIEPGQEDNWQLRPASPFMRLIALELNPPYSTRVWLGRILRRWVPGPDAMDCLPVWRIEKCE
jgi:hypothetical protein